MRFQTLTAALLFGAAAIAPFGAEAADSFDTQLLLKTELGPQVIKADTPLHAGSQLRLVVIANEDMTVSVNWQPSGGEAKPLASDVHLAKGQKLSVPGTKDWIALGAGDGREAFQVFATDAAGNVEQDQVAYVIMDSKVASIEQSTFSALTRAKPSGQAKPLSGFSAFSKSDFTGKKETGFAAQLAKVPAEPPTFSSAGSALFKKVADGVVLVLTNEGLGSGSMLTQDGEILTNWHVVKGYSVVGVVFRPPPGTPLSEDMIVLADVVKISESQDLALLKLRQEPKSRTTIEIGSMDNIDIGDEVHAIGHPQGESWTYTRGYISQIRDNYQWDIGLGVTQHGQVIQTQTPINPGNSGGPLMDNDGKLIGVNSFINLDSQGLNYALSVNEVKDFMAAPIAENQPPALGSQPQPAQPQPAQPQPSQPSQPKTAQPSQPAVPQPPQPAPQPEPPQQAEQEPEFYPLDTDGNGKTDAWGADRNGDGYYDVILVDEDGDGYADYALFDDNYNGVVDSKLVPTEDAQGPFDVWIFDDNEDGVADYYGLDWDQDGTIDEWRQG
jgi:S1-C subfamily serine protease